MPDYPAEYQVSDKKKAELPSIYGKVCRIIRPDIRQEKPDPAQPYLQHVAPFQSKFTRHLAEV